MFWTLPEVMMRINNREVRIEDRFRQRLRQPRIIRWMDSTESGGLSWFCHATPPAVPLASTAPLPRRQLSFAG
jgi:hypothetical protein